MPDLHLADLSDWNPGVNFDEYAVGGRPGVFLKATEGLNFRASTFPGYRDAAHAAGLVLVGAYHFAKGNSPAVANIVRTLGPGQRVAIDAHWSIDGRGRYRYHREDLTARVVQAHAAELAGVVAAEVNPPAGEAGHFLDAIGVLRTGEVAVLDAEVPGITASWCRAWLSAVRDATGRDPILYCSWSYWQDVLGSMTDFPLWIAAYHSLSHDDPRDSVPGCLFWQYTDAADVAGVGSADDSVFRGTIDDLAALGGSSSPPPPTPSEEEPMSHVTVRPGERQLIGVPVVGGGAGATWAAVTVTAPAPGAIIDLAQVWPSERKIDGLHQAKSFAGIANVAMQPGDEAVEIVNASPTVIVTVMVESGK